MRRHARRDGLGTQLDTDQVLRGQGADPATLRARRPALVGVAERALQVGTPLLQPRVAYEWLEGAKPAA